MKPKALPRSFYDRDAISVAHDLLNKVIVKGDVSGRIVEVEAYDGIDDPASHAYRGPTKRNLTMFGPPGHLYVYFTYGMHHCCNVVCREEGRAAAVLIRALAPLDGVENMRNRRPLAGPGDHHLASGPGKLCQALAITMGDNGADLVLRDSKRPNRLQVIDDGVRPPEIRAEGTRIGISAASELAWRWWVPGDPNVSKGSGRPAKAAKKITSM